MILFNGFWGGIVSFEVFFFWKGEFIGQLWINVKAILLREENFGKKVLRARKNFDLMIYLWLRFWEDGEKKMMKLLWAVRVEKKFDFDPRRSR